MPLMLLTASSILSVTSLCTCSGAAPGRRVVTATVGKSTCGSRSTPTGRKALRRQSVYTELTQGEYADDGQREDQDRGKARTTNADLSEPLHESTYLCVVTRDPSESFSTLLVATFSPALRPVAISTRSSTG